jgi:uncharacterized protein
MLYLDTSVLVALFSQESGSDLGQQLLDDWLSAGRSAVCSDWAAAELRCAIAAKHRANLISASDLPLIALALDGLCADKLEAAATLPSDVVRAGELAIARPAMRLRAGDALHIAIAARLGVTHFLSFDQDQAAAARQVLVGVKVLP